MQTSDEQPLEVIRKGELLLGKAKAVSEHIQRLVRQLLGEAATRTARHYPENRPAPRTSGVGPATAGRRAQ
jgi:transcription termination factor Rho